MSDIDDESEYEYIDSDVEEELVDDDYDDCSASFKLEVVLPNSFLPATTEDNQNTTDSQSPGPITEMSKLQMGDDVQSLSTGTVSSYTFLQPSMMSAQGETNSCASSVISGFEYLSIDGSTLRICHRCKCVNPEDSVVCLGCCAALVANPNVDMDEQIARHLQQNEEMELLRRKSALRGSSLLSQCDEFCKEISECLQEVISNGSLQPLSGVDITMQVSEFFSCLAGYGHKGVILGIGYFRTLNKKSIIRSIQKHGISGKQGKLKTIESFGFISKCVKESVRWALPQSLGIVPEAEAHQDNSYGGEVYWLVVFATGERSYGDGASHVYVSRNNCLPLGHFEHKEAPSIQKFEHKLIKTTSDFVEAVIRPEGSNTVVYTWTTDKTVVSLKGNDTVRQQDEGSLNHPREGKTMVNTRSTKNVVVSLQENGIVRHDGVQAASKRAHIKRVVAPRSSPRLRRPLSAYDLFFYEQRCLLMKKPINDKLLELYVRSRYNMATTNEGKEKGPEEICCRKRQQYVGKPCTQMSFASMTRHISNLWKEVSLNPSEGRKYRDMAKLSKDLYEEAVAWLHL